MSESLSEMEPPWRYDGYGRTVYRTNPDYVLQTIGESPVAAAEVARDYLNALESRSRLLDKVEEALRQMQAYCGQHMRHKGVGAGSVLLRKWDVDEWLFHVHALLADLDAQKESTP